MAALNRIGFAAIPLSLSQAPDLITGLARGRFVIDHGMRIGLRWLS